MTVGIKYEVRTQLTNIASYRCVCSGRAAPSCHVLVLFFLHLFPSSPPPLPRHLFPSISSPPPRPRHLVPATSSPPPATADGQGAGGRVARHYIEDEVTGTFYKLQSKRRKFFGLLRRKPHAVVVGDGCWVSGIWLAGEVVDRRWKGAKALLRCACSVARLLPLLTNAAGGRRG